MGIIKSNTLQRLFNFLPGKSAKSGDVNEELNQLIQFNNTAVEDLKNHEARITTTEEGGAFTSQKLDTHMGEAGHNNWYYTEQEIDTLLTELKGSGYTGESLKQLKSVITGLQEQINNLDDIYSTDAERIAAVNDIINQFTIANEDLSAMLSNKANKDNVYTKAETDEKVWDTMNLADMSVTRQKMANLSVGTPQLEDNAVTLAKLGTDIKANIGQTVDAIQVARITENERQALKEEYVTIEGAQSIISVPSNVVEGQLSAAGLSGNTYTNEVKNGNFASGTTGYVGNLGNISVLNNTLIQVGNGTSPSPYVGIHPIPAKVESFKKIFVKLRARVRNADCSALRLMFRGSSSGATTTIGTVSSPVQDTWYTISTVVVVGSGFSGTLELFMYHMYANSATANGKVMEMQEVLAIDMGTSASDPLYSLTADQMNARIPNWFDGTKQTDSVTVKSVGKNLILPFSIRQTLGTTVAHDNFWNLYPSISYAPENSITFTNVAVGSTRARIRFPKINPNQSYTLRWDETIAGASRVFMYRVIGSTIEHTAMSTSGVLTTTTTSSTTAIIIEIESANTATHTLSNLQIERGATATPYEPYTENSITTPPIGGSLPNGVKDEFSVPQGKLTKRNNGKIIQSADVISMFTGYALLDYAQIPKPSDSVYYNKQTNTLVGSSTIGNIAEFNSGVGYNNTDNIGKYTGVWSLTDFIIGFPKGTTLAQAREQLAGLTLNYQLATPIVTPHAEQDLAVYPSGTLFIEPTAGVLKENTTLPAISLKAATTLKAAHLAVPRRIEPALRELGVQVAQLKNSANNSSYGASPRLPVSPSVADMFFLTDEKIRIEYNGSHWQYLDGNLWRKLTITDGNIYAASARYTPQTLIGGQVTTAQTGINMTKDFLWYLNLKLNDADDYVHAEFQYGETPKIQFTFGYNWVTGARNGTTISVRDYVNVTHTYLGDVDLYNKPCDIIIWYDHKWGYFNVYVDNVLIGSYKPVAGGAIPASINKALVNIGSPTTSATLAYNYMASPLVTVIGDSITSGSPIHAPNPDHYAGADTYGRHYASLLSARIKNKGVKNHFVVNKGVNSDTTAGMKARFVADIVNTGCKYVFIHGGINDFQLGTAVPTQNKLDMLATAVANNIKPLLLGVLPTRTTSIAHQFAVDLRAAEHAAYPARDYVDLWKTIEGTAENVADDTKMIDDVHPNLVGHTAITAHLDQMIVV